MQGPLGDIGRHRDFLWDYQGDTGRDRYSKEFKEMCMKFAKGAM